MALAVHEYIERKQQWMAMPDDDPSSKATTSNTDHGDDAKLSAPKRNRFSDLFTIPPAVKQVFDKFPLITYEANELPARAPKNRHDHILHVFTTAEDGREGKPSFNPACLKWQAYLRFSDITFRTVPSSNHASPSGALPFLLPAASAAETAKSPNPIPSNKLERWVAAHQQGEKVQEPDDVRYEAYASLLDNRIRKAWLYQLYINPANYSLLHRLYITPCSSDPLVQLAIAHQLRSAAESELIKTLASKTIVEDDIYRDASEALGALSTLLGDNQWFFGQQKPSLFDASVFAYTQLILDDGLAWTDNRLAEMLRQHDNLVRHQERIADMYF